MDAVGRGDLDMVALLLQYGANVNVTDEVGYSALDFASMLQHHKKCANKLQPHKNWNRGTQAEIYNLLAAADRSQHESCS